jgi:hypothetical protein
MKKAIFGRENGKLKIVISEPIDGRYMKEQEILKKYWFFHPEKSPQRGSMCFGLECDEGWYPLLDKLCKKIEQLIDTKYPELKTQENPFEVMQVKEKFGTLRFYTNFSIDEIDDLITQAEDESARTCEVCSDKGKLRNYGWYKTMCKKCYEILLKERKIRNK